MTSSKHFKKYFTNSMLNGHQKNSNFLDNLASSILDVGEVILLVNVPKVTLLPNKIVNV